MPPDDTVAVERQLGSRVLPHLGQKPRTICGLLATVRSRRDPFVNSEWWGEWSE